MLYYQSERCILMENLVKMFDSLPFGGFIKAVLLLVLAFIVAALSKFLIKKFLKFVKADRLFNKIEMKEKSDPIEFIGKFVYLIVFLLFVPGIFTYLGLSNISEPITNVLNKIWGYLPNIVGAAVVVIVGLFVAKLVRQLLNSVFDHIKVNKLQEKLNVEVEESGKLSSVLAYIVYVLIVIPVVIAAINILNIDAISKPAMEVLNIIWAYIPSVIAALIIFVIGYFVGKFVGVLVQKLIAVSGINVKLEKYLAEKSDKELKINLAKIAGVTVNVVIVIFFVVEGINLLKLEVLTNIGTTIIAYLPNILAALLVIILCIIAGSLLDKFISNKTGSKVYGLIVKVAVFVVGVFIILNQLHIATTIVNSAFIIILCALGIAFAIAFGIGGREFASHTLKKLEERMSKDSDKKDDAK